MRSILCGALLLAATAAFGEKTAVNVDHTGDDSLGNTLAFQIREGVRKSAAMALEDRWGDAAVFVNLVTVDGDKENRGIYTVYAITISRWNVANVDEYMNTLVGTCGRRLISECATDIVASIDTVAAATREHYRKAAGKKSK